MGQNLTMTCSLESLLDSAYDTGWELFFEPDPDGGAV